MKPTELSIGNEIFTDLRIKMDVALNAVISNLIEKKLNEGKVTAKIDIQLFTKTDQETGELLYEPVFEPEVNVNIGAKSKLECTTQAGLIVKKSKCGRNFIGTNQISFDDLMDKADQEEKGA